MAERHFGWQAAQTVFTDVPSSFFESTFRRVGMGSYANCDAVTDKGNQFGKTIATTRSDGIATGGTYRVQHRILREFFGTRLVYTNFNVDDTQVDTITVRAAIESSGSFWPVFFNGQRSVVIEPGCMVVSDPVSFGGVADATFYSRTFVSVASAGLKWPLGQLTTLVANSEGNNVATGTDVSLGGAVSVTQAQAYSPFAIVAEHATGRLPFVAIVGDSIASGTGTAVTDPPSGDAGYVSLALQSARIGYVNPSRTGDNASHWMTSFTIRYLPLRRAAVLGCTHAIVTLGINDVNGAASFATMQSRLQAIWSFLAAAGLTVFQTTLTPSTTSTDGWVTTANQTVKATETVRTQTNDWIRTNPAGISGYFEVADIVETARNSGIFKAAYTTDGTHPTTAAHVLMADAIVASRLVV